MYNAQVKEYKEILKDPDRIARKAVDILSKTKAYRDFMSKNTLLASIFNIPSSATAASAPVIPGLQSSGQVNAALAQSLGISPTTATQFIQSNLQQVQPQFLDQLKSKVNQLGGGNDEQLKDPDELKNKQRVKKLWDRIELSTNLQSTNRNAWLPSSSDLGLMAGYRISDHFTVGIGISGKIGWGHDLKHIIVSYQGVGGRSYFEYQLHKSLWFTGSYELNYYASFSRIEALKNLSAYQPSGLIGLMKKYKLGKKMKGKMSLLWNFLSYRQQPQQQAIVWRLGYSLK